MKFPRGRVYIIIPSLSVTTAMVNKSTSTTSSQMPTKTSGVTTYVLLETSEPVDSAFDNYVWHGIDTIQAAWDAT